MPTPATAAVHATVFHSVHHPGSAGLSLVYARNLVLPLATCMLPVMIMTLIDVLQGRAALPYLIWGFPLATVFAFAWTSYCIRAAPAELVVGFGLANVRSVYEVARRHPMRAGRPVLDVRKSRHHFEVAIGETSYEMADAEWPDREALIASLREARLTARSELGDFPEQPNRAQSARGGT